MEWREGEEVREWREQLAQLTDIVTEKNQHIQELETQVWLVILLMPYLQLASLFAIASCLVLLN